MISPDCSAGPHNLRVAHRTSEEREEGMASDLLRRPIPIDDRQWSIPSIRLANHLKTDLDSSLHSYQDTSHTFSDDEYTDEGISLDDSYSYLGDGDENDDTSLSSKGSYDPQVRRRFFTGVLRRKSTGGSSSGSPQVIPKTLMTNLSVLPSNDTFQDTYNPAIAMTTSFLEKNLGRITIESKVGDATNARQSSGTFEDSETGDEILTDQWSPTPSLRAAPPILHVATPYSIDDAGVDYYGGEHGDRHFRARSRRQGRRHRERRKRGKTHSGSTAAFEWLQDLQNQPSNQLLIAEAASSKFLTGNTGGSDGAGIGAGCSAPSPSDDVSKVLGMPHPLCRSTTIDAQYVHRTGFGLTQQVSNGNNDMLGASNPIALTSSGSS